MKKLGAVLLVLLLPVVALTAVAGAQTFRSGQSASVRENETIDSSAWIAGTHVDIAGTVNGDVYCAGQSVKISGTVNGDVICAGEMVTISGEVNGDVRAAGSTVIVGGTVDGSISLLGMTLSTDGDAVIGRDAAFMGSDIFVKGEIGRDVTIGAGNVVIDAAVGRDISAQVEALTLENATVVGGALNYSSPQKVETNGAQIAGETNFTKWEKSERDDSPYNFGMMAFGAAMLYVSALISALLLPRALHRSTDSAVKTPTKALLALAIGLAATIVVPVALIMLMFTIFALPFALAALVAWLLVLMASGVVAAYYLGRVVWRKGTNAVGIMAIGALVLVVVGMLPYLGFAVCLLSCWLGTGLILLELKKRMVVPTYDTKLLK